MIVYKKQDVFSIEKGMKHGDTLLLRKSRREYVFWIRKDIRYMRFFLFLFLFYLFREEKRNKVI